MVKVSVAMLAYNHEKYIEQAVRSALMQQTDFEYEIVIGEDCSTDATREILLRLKDEHPDKIRLLLHEENLGVTGNFNAVWSACRGDYIALLEGDDFWISPIKLQRQTKFLDANPGCVLCSHDVEKVYEDVNTTRFHKHRGCIEADSYCVDDILLGRIPIPTPSVMVRKIEEQLPSWYVNLHAMGDLSLQTWLLLSTGGSVSQLCDLPMAAYRIHSHGISNKTIPFERMQFRLSTALDWMLLIENLPFNSKQISLIRLKVFVPVNEAMLFYDRIGDPRKAKAIFKKHILGTQWLGFYTKRFVFGLLLKLYFPDLYDRLEFVRRRVRAT